MKKRTELFLLLFFLGTGALMMVLRKLINPEIPTPISLAIGVMLLGYGLVLSILEYRNHVGVSYAYGENWNGGGFINSGVILGVSMFFFSGNIRFGWLLFLLFSVVFFAKWKILSQGKAEGR